MYYNSSVGTWPVFIKSWILKSLIVFGIVIPIIVTAVGARQANPVISNALAQIIFFPFSISLILLPFTGMLRDIMKALPQNYIFNRLSSLRDRVEIDKYIDEGATQEEREKRAKTFFGLNNFMAVTGLEYISLCIGVVIFLTMILVFFVKT